MPPTSLGPLGLEVFVLRAQLLHPSLRERAEEITGETVRARTGERWQNGGTRQTRRTEQTQGRDEAVSKLSRSVLAGGMGERTRANEKGEDRLEARETE